MFFEGSEKKVEAVVSGVNLIDLGDEFWSEVVKASRAQILSKISTSECISYLLSESSLFVWKDRFTMITCGETTLAKAVDHCIQSIGKEHFDFLTYERKNEYFPEKQETHFFDDLKIIQKHMNGKAFRFGDEKEHHLYLFHTTKPYQPPAEDVTLEILMYGLQGTPREIFNSSQQTLKNIHEKTAVTSILPNFQVDDYLFEPCGYSLNALSGSDYYTIHVTPQDLGAYVSFETNAKIDQNYLPVLKKVIDTFNPKAFDVVVFRSCSQEFIEVPGFNINSAIKQDLNCGYCVNHLHFEQSTESDKNFKSVIDKSKTADEIWETE